MQEKNVIA